MWAVFELDDQRVTHMLADFAAGDRAAARDLLPKVYADLRRLAATHLSDHRSAHTLQPTALVHEVFVRLSEGSQPTVADRRHFFRLASKLMRQILVDHARARDAEKRGGHVSRITLSAVHDLAAPVDVDILALTDALDRLEAFSPRKARLVELRFFGGLSEAQAADALDISRTQAAREWRTARAWLADEMAAQDGDTV
jgi:RNA polymerase sigma factor (TIGR02999 family)